MLSATSTVRVADSPDFAIFSTRVAELAAVTGIAALEPDDAVVFFVNIYNMLMLHMYIVAPTPSSARGILAYVNGYGYALGELGIVTPFDIEHLIIRASSARPDFLGASLILPSSSPRAATFAPVRFAAPVPLVSFLLCSGAKSGPGLVVLDPDAPLREQMVAAAGAYLGASVVVNRLTGTLYLPKLLEWYAADFEPVAAGSAPVGIVPVMRALLAPRLRFELDALFKANAEPKIKYTDWEWDMHRIRLPFDSGVSPLFYFEHRLASQVDAAGRTLATILHYMREELPLGAHRHRFKRYEAAFTGQAAVDWLVYIVGGYRSRKDAAATATAMLRAGGLISTAAQPDSLTLAVLDKSTEFYTFQTPWDEYTVRVQYRAELGELATRLASSVDVADRTYHARLYPACFVASEAVDALSTLVSHASRRDAIARGTELFNEGFIYHVAHKQAFADKFYFFRFRHGLALAALLPPGLEWLAPPPLDQIEADSMPQSSPSATEAETDLAAPLETIFIRDSLRSAAASSSPISFFFRSATRQRVTHSSASLNSA
ncbi:uncharacterized protein AMSG_03595 [Thecamonas trahens ATCC 50062]|uniref:DEP domain-containing protein n=1 Tax=Thecamonas trahens ATCC 50062 TaxID=461836 RepID=A0A0L0D481_THETB|nr:hypothetical protein AMSG_03595 [Thecamonas trahens ATCC 50062]KNC47167.1 hypothetical protein AMSG_03595 [Thecamonas trahens ATCC 50062]|eukprot:XP_013759941.1 hypothetical protein AMSG_03595 [Thecamonas trahens ATCC 50062]